MSETYCIRRLRNSNEIEIHSHSNHKVAVVSTWDNDLAHRIVRMLNEEGKYYKPEYTGCEPTLKKAPDPMKVQY